MLYNVYIVWLQFTNIFRGNAVNKKYFKIIIGAIIITFVSLIYVKNKEIKTLQRKLYSTEVSLVNTYYMGVPITYYFEQVKANPSRENIDVLYKKMKEFQKFFVMLVNMKKELLSKEILQKLENNRLDTKSIDFVLNITYDNKLDDIKLEKLSEIQAVYHNLYKISLNDLSKLEGVSNINSLIYSYIFFITEINNLDV